MGPLIDLSITVPRVALRRRGPQWLADLLMGARFAASGGRDGLTRTVMTAVGVGLGVAMMLLALAVPGTWGTRNHRLDAREPTAYATSTAGTLLVGDASSTYHGAFVRGRLVRPQGADAPVPPGLPALPAPGTAYLSPALRDLLASPQGALLRPRVPYRIVGTIADTGLSGPAELAYYAGSDTLALRDAGYVSEVVAFGRPIHSEGLDPLLLLFVVVIFVVLLLPVGVFIAAAVRFGGEQRDRRLAALRLVGADTRMARRIAAGEALAAALLGLLAGGALFLLGRQIAEHITMQDLSVYAADIHPGPDAVLLVAVVVPALAVAVSLLALRGVVIEPLGVVRRARPARARLWWRLVLPAAGLALLYPLAGRFTRDDPAPVGPYRIAAGVVLMLLGVTALLPWVVEATVARLGHGPVAWQLAIRRLQQGGASPARVVNGIAVAVAGAIALQMLFLGLEPSYTRVTDADLQIANAVVQAPTAQAAEARRALPGTPGVTGVVSIVPLQLTAPDGETTVDALVADCATLRGLATLASCTDGDVFLAPSAAVPITPGARLTVGDDHLAWQVPAATRTVPAARFGDGSPFAGLMLTLAAAPRGALTDQATEVYLHTDPADPEAVERARNTIAAISPTIPFTQIAETTVVNRFATLRRGLFIGAVITLLLIGLSLLVGVLEQLRDRRRLLAMLHAVGVGRSTLSWSILWQTALPVALGLLLAVPAGVGLGAVLLAMVRAPIRIDVPAIAGMTGAAAAVVLLVTAAGLPALWRILRPESLRTE